MKPYVWVIIGLVAVIVALILFWPDSKPNQREIEREQAYQTQIAILRSDSANSAHRIDSIKQKAEDSLQSVNVQLRAKESENRVLRINLSKSRKQVQHLIDSIPELKTFVGQQDSLIQNQDEQIEILRGGLYNLGRDFNALVGEQEINARISSDMLLACEQRHSDIMDLKNRELKKAKRGSRGWKVGAVVGTVGAFLLGSQL